MIPFSTQLVPPLRWVKNHRSWRSVVGEARNPTQVAPRGDSFIEGDCPLHWWSRCFAHFVCQSGGFANDDDGQKASEMKRKRGRLRRRGLNLEKACRCARGARVARSLRTSNRVSGKEQMCFPRSSTINLSWLTTRIIVYNNQVNVSPVLAINFVGNLLIFIFAQFEEARRWPLNLSISLNMAIEKFQNSLDYTQWPL